jgi:hypothetical protein
MNHHDKKLTNVFLVAIIRHIEYLDHEEGLSML